MQSTGEKGFSKNFFRYIGLSVLATMGLSCYILADTFFISSVMGENGIAALNLAIPVFSLITAVGLMIGMGAGTRYGVVRSAGDEKEGNRIFTAAITLGLLFGLLFMLAGLLFSGQISHLLGADADTHAMTDEYLRTLITFAPAFIVNNILTVFVRNDGAPKLAMTAMLTSSFSNIVLDYVFMYPLQMGMFGAAFATGLAPLLSMLVLLTHFLGGKNGFRFARGSVSAKRYGRLLSLGLSSFVTEVSSGVVIVVFNMIILSLRGNIGVAAYGIIANLSLVVTAVFTGIAQGVQPLLSAMKGGGKTAEIHRVYRSAILLSSLLAVVIYAAVFFFSKEVVSVFNSGNNQSLTELAVTGVRIYFIAFVFAGINILTAVYFSATENAVHSFIISMARGVVVLIPAAFLFSTIFDMNGVWLSFPAAEILTAVISVILYKHQKGAVLSRK